MNDWPIALSTGCFSRNPILEFLELISSAGFNQVEICSLPSHFNFHDKAIVQQTTHRLQDLGLMACSFHAPFADHIDITSLDERKRRQSIGEVLVAADAAAALSARCFVIHPGPEHSGEPPLGERERRLEHVAASLSEIANRCHEMGVLCVLENKLPHLLFGNIPDMMWILGAMSTTQVGACLDTGHAHLAGDLDNAVQKLASHLRLVHASDNFGRYDDHRPPGCGDINWGRFLAQLREVAYAAPIVLEIAGQGSRDDTLRAAQEAVQFLRKQMAPLG
jgi:sugar phosphate isomerase/epimerase